MQPHVQTTHDLARVLTSSGNVVRSLQNELRNALTKDCPGSSIQIDVLFDGGLGGGNGVPHWNRCLPRSLCVCSHYVAHMLGSEFIGKLAELYVKNTSAALSAVSAKLAEIAADGKVSLAQATEVFESLEVGNGPEPPVGICGGEGTCQPTSISFAARLRVFRGWHASH